MEHEVSALNVLAAGFIYNNMTICEFTQFNGKKSPIQLLYADFPEYHPYTNIPTHQLGGML